MLSTYWPSLPLPSQMTAFVKLLRYPCPAGSPNFFAASGAGGGIGLKIVAPAKHASIDILHIFEAFLLKFQASLV